MILRSGLRKAYHPPPLPPATVAHEWWFLRPDLTITTTEPYSTGTVEVVNGVVTLTGGTLPSWTANAWFIADSHYYAVSTRDGDTQLTLEDTSLDLDALTTYSLRQYRYSLPNDFQALDGKLCYSPDQSTWNIPLERRSDEQIRQVYQDSDSDTFFGEPQFYAIAPAAINTAAVPAWYLHLWPTADSVFKLKGRYQVTMDDLDATNQYPPGGAQHAQMILEACLSEAELKMDGTPGHHTEEFLKCLAASISLDRNTGAPDTLGVAPVCRTRYQSDALFDQSPVIYDGFALSVLRHKEHLNERSSLSLRPGRLCEGERFCPG
jgi:hypothetical protein